jgi:site-specific DNA recombinase
MTMERVVVYARVSTDLQERQETIETQLMVVRDACEARDWEVLREFRDEGVSGTVPLDERPGGAALLAFLSEERGVARTVVYDTSRVGRDELVSLLAEKSLKDLGAPLTSATQPLPDDDKSPFSVMARGNTRTADAVYRATVRQNTMNGRYRKVREGTHYLASRTPYGYVRRTERDGAGRLARSWLEPEPAQAAVVRRVFALAVGGLGLRAIAARLRGEGAALHWRTVAKLAHARRYAGEGSYAGLAMGCPPLVDVATFEAAQAALARRRDVRPRPSAEPWLLGGLVWCGHCGSKFSARTANGRRTYYCRRRRERGPSGGHEGVRWTRPADELEARVKRHVLRALNDPEGMLREARVHEERADRLGAEREGDAARLRGRLDALDEERRRAQRLARKGLLTEAELADQLGEVARERGAAEAGLADLLRAPLDAARLRNWAALLRDTAEVWREAARVLGPVPADALDPDALPLPVDWRGLVRQFVERVTVNDDGSVGVEGVLTCPPSR